VLGCTHYPFLRPRIAELAGPAVTLLESGEAVARQTRRVLERENLLAAREVGNLQWLTSGDPALTGPVIERLLTVTASYRAMLPLIGFAMLPSEAPWNVHGPPCIPARLQPRAEGLR